MASTQAASTISPNNQVLKLHQSYSSPYLQSSQHQHNQHLLKSYQSYCNCVKFVPQAFNINKCQQCFNFKDQHSIEALADYTKVSQNFVQILFKSISLDMISFQFNQVK
jgi:hypothetical protein